MNRVRTAFTTSTPTPTPFSFALSLSRLSNCATNSTLIRPFGAMSASLSRRSLHSTASLKSNLDMLTNPFGSIKLKMNKIDHARYAYESCSLQFYENNQFMEKFNLPDNLQSWFNVTVLHVWMYSAQLKTLGPEGKEMCQELFATLLLDIEIRLSKAGVRTNLDRITSDLISTYYGQILAYDEGLALGGDAILASALWRNVFQAADDVSAQDLKKMVEYVRIQLQHLDGKQLVELGKTIKFLDLPDL